MKIAGTEHIVGAWKDNLRHVIPNGVCEVGISAPSHDFCAMNPSFRLLPFYSLPFESIKSK
jgi:hypothetical protein